MKKSLILTLVAALALGAIAAPSAVAGKKKKKKSAVTKTFEESGTIAAPAVTGIAIGGLTTAEFVLLNECASLPASQGFDGHIVEIPADFRLGSAELEILGSAAGTYDLDAYFYDAGCGLMEPYMRDGADPKGPIPPGAAWIAIELFVGANTSFDLKATATVSGK